MTVYNLISESIMLLCDPPMLMWLSEYKAYSTSVFL